MNNNEINVDNKTHNTRDTIRKVKLNIITKSSTANTFTKCSPLVKRCALICLQSKINRKACTKKK